jgi:hypothetical protein
MLTFYDEQPVDWLITYFCLSMAQKKGLLRHPTLFQHVRLKSSFDTSRDNKLKDRFFNDNSDRPDNPPAVVLTQMRAFDSNLPVFAYEGSGFFWATGVTAGDTLGVIFNEEQTNACCCGNRGQQAPTGHTSLGARGSQSASDQHGSRVANCFVCQFHQDR